jgi:tRNA(Ile2) C34 agmatinyltransferase TiaS
MPQSQFVLRQLQIVERPKCQRCGGKMMLASIEPHAAGVDLRTFQCDKCAHAETALVKFA